MSLHFAAAFPFLQPDQNPAMSNIAFRDSSVIIIETGRTKVRAIMGLADLLRLPYVVSLLKTQIYYCQFISTFRKSLLV